VTRPSPRCAATPYRRSILQLRHARRENLRFAPGITAMAITGCSGEVSLNTSAGIPRQVSDDGRIIACHSPFPEEFLLKDTALRSKTGCRCKWRPIDGSPVRSATAAQQYESLRTHHDPCLAVHDHPMAFFRPGFHTGRGTALTRTCPASLDDDSRRALARPQQV